MEEARSYLGAPYLWGGMSERGIDCSGLVHMAWRRLGRLVPRDADQQEEAARSVDEPRLRRSRHVRPSRRRRTSPSGSARGESCTQRGADRVVEEPEPAELRRDPARFRPTHALKPDSLIRAKGSPAAGRYRVRGRCRTSSDHESLYGPQPPLRGGCSQALDTGRPRSSPSRRSCVTSQQEPTRREIQVLQLVVGGPRQPRDRRAPLPLGGDGQVARPPPAREAAGSQPRPRRGSRLPPGPDQLSDEHSATITPVSTACVEPPDGGMLPGCGTGRSGRLYQVLLSPNSSGEHRERAEQRQNRT